MNDMTLAQAQTTLRAFTCVNEPTSEPTPSPNLALVREALLQVTRHSDYQLLGVCADTFEKGIIALQSYLKALGYPSEINLNGMPGSVYIKFNGKVGSCYLDSYTGIYRGVLVSCQSQLPEGVNETYGHLPLSLFEDVQPV